MVMVMGFWGVLGVLGWVSMPCAFHFLLSTRQIFVWHLKPHLKPPKPLNPVFQYHFQAFVFLTCCVQNMQNIQKMKASFSAHVALISQ